MTGGVNKASDLVDRWFAASGIEVKNAGVINVWREVVSGIYNSGSQLAAHSRVVDLENGKLLVEADHSGWIQLLQLNRAYILKGLKMKIPELEINVLAFKLSQEKFDNPDGEKLLSRAELLRKLNKGGRGEEAPDGAAEKGGNAGKSLDSALKELFDKLKKDIQEC